MTSIYISNISIFRTIETFAIVKILLLILLLLPLYYHDSTIAKVTIAMHQQVDNNPKPDLDNINTYSKFG